MLFWIPEHHALVVGDALMGDGEGGLRLHRDELREALRAAARARGRARARLPRRAVRGDAELQALLASPCPRAGVVSARAEALPARGALEPEVELVEDPEHRLVDDVVDLLGRW